MGDSATPRISASVKDNVATVVIDNPAQRNALTLAMCLALQEAMPKLDEDPDINVVVLRGAGNAFCSGVAINELSSVLAEPHDGVAGVDHLSRADTEISSITKPNSGIGGWALHGRRVADRLGLRFHHLQRTVYLCHHSGQDRNYLSEDRN